MTAKNKKPPKRKTSLGIIKNPPRRSPRTNRKLLSHCTYCGGLRDIRYGGTTPRGHRNSNNPLHSTMFGRHRKSLPHDDDRVTITPMDHNTLPPPKTPQFFSKDRPSASQGLMVDEKGGAFTNVQNRTRRQIAIFHILVISQDLRKMFRLAIWKVDHGSPIHYARKDLNECKIIKGTTGIVQIEKKCYTLHMTKEILDTALQSRDKYRNQGRVMGIRRTISAKEACEEGYNIPLSENKIIVEWNHLVAHRFAAGASQKSHNLVIATKECNSHMEALESAIQVILEKDISLTLDVSADTVEETHIAASIQYSVRFDNGNMVTVQFDPAATEKTDLSLKEYFYDLLIKVHDNPETADRLDAKEKPKVGTLRIEDLYQPEPNSPYLSRKRSVNCVNPSTIPKKLTF